MEAPRLERKLVAILAADIEGYSRHMERDEVATLATLSGHRLIVDGLIARYHGRITGTAGDSVLAEFGSVVDAVDCAVEIQKVIAASSEDIPPERRMLFRIGVNVGDVMVKDGDIFGDGVNVAARLEALAEPGGICVSRGVRDHLRKQSPYAFEDLGEQSVKNIAQAVRAFRVRFETAFEPGPAQNQETIPPSSDATDDTAPTGSQSAPFELAFWDAIKDSSDGTEFDAYLERYPEGAFVTLAQARRDALLEGGKEGATRSAEPEPNPEPVEVELTFWESIKDSRTAAEIEAYLAQYPEGRFAGLARARLSAFTEGTAMPPTPPTDAGQAVEIAFWDTVKESGNPAMYEAYLADYPQGAFVALAKVRLSELSR